MAEVELSGVLRSISGTLGNFTFRNTRNGIVIADRARRSTAGPTAEQSLVQSYFTTATKQWKQLTDPQRAAWEEYAAAYFPQDRDRTGAGPVGQVVYIKAAWYQQLAGLTLPAAAPSVPPPPSATDITVQSASAAGTLTLRIAHGIGTVTGFRVLVEATPPMLSAARRPLETEYRAVMGIAAASVPALVNSTTNYVFSAIRYPLVDGERFGCRVTIINASGIPGPAFVKELEQVGP